MPVDERYRRQVDLLVRTLPHVAQEKCFALKGGTAINLFVRNLLLGCRSTSTSLIYRLPDEHGRSRPLAGVHGFRGVTPMDTPELQELSPATQPPRGDIRL